MNQVPGSFSAASAPSGDCGRVLVTLPAASSPRSTAEEEQDTKTRVRTVETTATVQELERKKESKIEKEKKTEALFLLLYFTSYKMSQNISEV